MLLSELQNGEYGIVSKVRGRGAFRKRITEMGFVRGKKVTVVKNAPLRDPIEYSVLGYQISLRRSEASLIEVITPDEAKVWGLQGGSNIQTFDTDCGKIGVLICYDVEFPELSRLLADDGMNILFVPFLSDTQNGYSRVRNCAQARAIENECYVAIAGSVGNLPRVHNMDIQYAQSMVFTPCDFSFPTNGIKAEATPNTEMILIADVDIDLLRELNQFGGVRNLRDRRTDIYSLKRVKK